MSPTGSRPTAAEIAWMRMVATRDEESALRVTPEELALVREILQRQKEAERERKS